MIAQGRRGTKRRRHPKRRRSGSLQALMAIDLTDRRLATRRFVNPVAPYQ